MGSHCVYLHNKRNVNIVDSTAPLCGCVAQSGSTTPTATRASSLSIWLSTTTIIHVSSACVVSTVVASGAPSLPTCMCILSEEFLRKAIGNYRFVLLTNRASPQRSDIKPDLRQRALRITSRAAWRWNKVLLVRENVDRPLSAMVVATEHNAR